MEHYLSGVAAHMGPTLAVFFAAFTQSITGFGLVIIAAPLLMFFYEPKLTVPVMLLLACSGNAAQGFLMLPAGQLPSYSLDVSWHARRTAHRLLLLHLHFQRCAEGLHQRCRPCHAPPYADFTPPHRRTPAEHRHHRNALGIHRDYNGHGRTPLSHLPRLFEDAP